MYGEKTKGYLSIHQNMAYTLTLLAPNKIQLTYSNFFPMEGVVIVSTFDYTYTSETMEIVQYSDGFTTVIFNTAPGNGGGNDALESTAGVGGVRGHDCLDT